MKKPLILALAAVGLLIAFVVAATVYRSSRDQETQEMVEKAKEYIRAGDIFQVVPAQRWTQDFPRFGT